MECPTEQSAQTVGVRSQLGDARLGCGYIAQGDGLFAEADSQFAEAYTVFKQLWDESPHNFRLAHAACCALESRANLYYESGQFQQAQAWFESTLKLRRQLQQLNPENSDYRASLISLLDSVASMHQAEGGPDEADAIYEEVLRLCREDRETNRNDEHTATEYARLLIARSHVRNERGNRQAATDLFGEAESVAKETLDKNPTSENALLQLCSAWLARGDQEMARGRLREAEAILVKAFDSLHPNWDEESASLIVDNLLAATLDTLALTRRELALFADAEEHLRESARFRKYLGERDRKNVNLWLGWARTMHNLALVYSEQSKFDEMLDASSQSVEQTRHLWKHFGRQLENGMMLAISLTQRCYSLTDLGRFGDAEELGRESVEMLGDLVNRQPQSVGARGSRGRALSVLARCLLRVGQCTEACELLSESVEIQQGLCDGQPESLEFFENLGLALNLWGDCHTALGDSLSAFHAWNRVREALTAKWEANVGNVNFGPVLGEANRRVSLYGLETGQLAGSENVLYQAVDIYRRLTEANDRNYEMACGYATITSDYAQLLLFTGDADRAIDAARLAVDFLEGFSDRCGTCCEVDLALAYSLYVTADAERYLGFAEAPSTCDRAIASYGQLYECRPQYVAAGIGLARALDLSIQIGVESGCRGELTSTLDRAAKIWDRLLDDPPTLIWCHAGLAGHERLAAHVLRAEKQSSTVWQPIVGSAADRFRHLRESEPSHWCFPLGLADCLLQLGEVHSAAVEIDAVLSAVPAHRDAVALRDECGKLRSWWRRCFR